MMQKRRYTHALERLQTAGLRPTKQRLALAKLLFDKGDRHVTAEQLHAEAGDSRVVVSLATIYNTLHQFTRSGLLREVVVEQGRSYFDTNTSEHHHFFNESTGELIDLPSSPMLVDNLPAPPAGTRISRIDVVIRLSDA